jgi:hypothetical protein
MPILFLIIFISFSSFAQDVKIESAKRQWHVLLHYKKSLLGGYKSEVDHENFFLSSEGKWNPEAEMIASIKEFSREDISTSINHPQCVFPARFSYIKETFKLNVKSVECTDLEWWKNNLPFHSVSIIFASYYANNPASMFGHTFLRINSSEERSVSDYGVDFSAISNTDSGLEFALRGLLGGYTGMYSIKPYYMKLNVYIENENRDLWEYDLKLSNIQIETMINHLWELLRYGHFDYFFLDENCSYQLLTLLEVANPDWYLSDDFIVKTIPIDTIKAFKKTGALKKVTYRPAFKKTVVQRLQLLTDSEKEKVKSIVKFKTKPTQVTSAKILEGAIATLRYERFEEKKFTNEQELLLKEILIQRSKVGGRVDYQDIQETLPIGKLRPDLSHGSEKFTFSFGENSLSDAYGEIGYRASLHDQLDFDNGYPKHAMIEMGNFKLRTVKNRFFLQELKYAEAFSIFPLGEDEFKWSWRAGGRSYRVYDERCLYCISHQLKSGGGVSKNLDFIDLDVYSMLVLNAELGRSFYRGYRVAPGLNAGLIWTLQDNWKAIYELEVLKDINAPESYKDFRKSHQYGMSYNLKLVHELRLTGKSWSTLKNSSPVEEFQFNYGYYY